MELSELKDRIIASFSGMEIEYDGVIRNYKDTDLLEQIGVFIALIPESVLPICAKAFSDENKWERVDYLGYGDLFSKTEDLPTESIADFLDKRRQTPTDGRQTSAIIGEKTHETMDNRRQKQC